MTAALSLAEQGFPVHLVEKTGELGGNLRHLYGDFLDYAATVVKPDLSGVADAYREAAGAWDRVAAVCLEVPAVVAVVDADKDRRAAVARGDKGRQDAAAAAAVSNRLLGADSVDLDREAMLGLFTRMAEAIGEAVAAERAALDSLRKVTG